MANRSDQERKEESMKKLYHNVTQVNFNQPDLDKLIEEINVGDVIIWTELGNEYVNIFTQEKIRKLKEQWRESN